MHHRLQVARRSEQPDDISHCPSPSSPGCDSPLRPVSPRCGRSLTISHSWLSDRPTVRAARARPQGNLALLTNGPVNTNAQKPHLRRRREGREETCLAPPTEDTAHDHLGRRKKRLLRAREQLGQGGASPRHLPPASSWGLARGSPLDRTSGPAVSSPSAPATRILPEKHAASPCPRSAAPGGWSLAPGHDAYATSVSGSRGCGVTSRRRKTKGEGRARNTQPSEREAAAAEPDRAGRCGRSVSRSAVVHLLLRLLYQCNCVRGGRTGETRGHTGLGASRGLGHRGRLRTCPRE